jgi:hypothetical protein
MNDQGRMFWLGAGIVAGVIGAIVYLGPGRSVQAANDRYEDYVMCTGTVTGTIPVRSGVASQTDGLWLLDYRSGKLLGTVIDRVHGRIVGWAEMDLVREFGIAPRQNVHFMMTTGSLNYGQAALYVAETSTGRFGVYTMGPRMDGSLGVMIRRHDLSTFRAPPDAK